MTREDLRKLTIRGLWKHFASLVDLLRTVYPEYDWDPSRFRALSRKAPAGHWDEKANIMKALEKAEQHMGIQKVPYIP